MEKIVREGMVAVAVSPGFGAGWSTWNDVSPMDARLNKLFIEGKYDEVRAICEEEDMYDGGVDDVGIQWIPVGSHFRITEYDGSETLELRDEIEWEIA